MKYNNMFNINDSEVEIAIKIKDKNNNKIFISVGDKVRFKPIDRAKDIYEGEIKIMSKDMIFYVDGEYFSPIEIESIELLES